METKNEITKKLRRTYSDVRREFNKKRNTEDEAYWQGKKDGLRIALAMLQPGESWELLNETSTGSQVTETERYKAMLKNALYSMADLLATIEDGEKLHPQSRLNARRWMENYHRQAREGIVEPVDDDCYRNRLSD